MSTFEVLLLIEVGIISFCHLVGIPWWRRG